MSYVVLARKWRSAQFSDIIGQGPVVRTLSQSILSGRLHHAYLFTGTRGIGKTSIARILAKAVRCQNRKVVEGQIEVCGECSDCREITAGRSVDVLEIDGASNNGVDAIREIRDAALYLPSHGDKKIYIIDEVHMLTTAAFNALLKTLEEPPAHVLFIFATTEPHKIPSTILSRCMRFDLKRVTTAQIQGRLQHILTAEGVKFELPALNLLARLADGSMRDALSLTEQAIAFSGESLTVHSVRESAGALSGEDLLQMVRDLFAHNSIAVLTTVQRLYETGHDLKQILKSVLEFVHATLLNKVNFKNPETLGLSISQDEWNSLGEASASIEVDRLELIFHILHHGFETISRSPQPKLVLDVLLMKCCSAESPYQDQPQPTPSKTRKESPVSGFSKVDVSSVVASMSSPSNFTSSVTATGTKAQISTVSSVSTKPATSEKEEVSFQKFFGGNQAPKPIAVTGNPIQPASSFLRIYSGFIAFVKQTRPLLANILEHAECPEFDLTEQGRKPELSLHFDTSAVTYYRDQLNSAPYPEQLRLLTQEFFGNSKTIQAELRQGIMNSPAAMKVSQEKAEELVKQNLVKNHPFVLEAQRAFGARLSEVEKFNNGAS